MQSRECERWGESQRLECDENSEGLARLRLLFIDDEPNILSGLRRAVRKQRKQWDCTFCDNPEEAIALIDRQHFDVVISDMRMPNIDGYQVLKHCAEVSPLTFRILLSGQASEVSVLNVAKYAHQFLAKPCEADNLIKRLEDLCFISQQAYPDTLKNALYNINQLPCNKEALEKLRQALDEEKSLDDLATLVMQDMYITVKTLHLANFLFLKDEKVFTVKKALEHIGLNKYKALLSEDEFVSDFGLDSEQKQAIHRIWTHCLRTSYFSLLLAKENSISALEQERLLMAALLHDFGLYILAIEGTDSDSRPQGLATHESIGAAAFKIWGFSDEIIELVQDHHAYTLFHEKSEKEGGLKDYGMAASLLHIADHVDAECLELDPGLQLSGINQEVIEKAGFKDKLEAWVQLLQEQSDDMHQRKVFIR